MSENIQQSQIHPITCTDSIGSDDGCQIDHFLDNRLEKAQHLSKSKQSKPRRTLSKVTSGRTITEDENFLKIKEFREQSKGKAKSGINTKNNSTKRKGKIVNQNIKKQKLKDSKLTQTIIDDERPSTSGLIFGAQGPLVVEDSFELTDSEDDTDNIPCCMCNQRYPPTLKHVVSLTIMNWAQCEDCDHWTHLRYCSPVNVVRSKSVFRCPHCDSK